MTCATDHTLLWLEGKKRTPTPLKKKKRKNPRRCLFQTRCLVPTRFLATHVFVTQMKYLSSLKCIFFLYCTCEVRHQSSLVNLFLSHCCLWIVKPMWSWSAIRQPIIGHKMWTIKNVINRSVIVSFYSALDSLFWHKAVTSMLVLCFFSMHPISGELLSLFVLDSWPLN